MQCHILDDTSSRTYSEFMKIIKFDNGDHSVDFDLPLGKVLIGSFDKSLKREKTTNLVITLWNESFHGQVWEQVCLAKSYFWDLMTVQEY